MLLKHCEPHSVTPLPLGEVKAVPRRSAADADALGPPADAAAREVDPWAVDVGAGESAPNRTALVAVAALVAALVAGCDNKPATAPMPEVNDENCKPENIAKIEDKGVQQAFSSLCLRRGGDFKPSPKREW